MKQSEADCTPSRGLRQIVACLRDLEPPRRAFILDIARLLARGANWPPAQRKSQSASILRRAKRFGFRGEELLQLKKRLELHTVTTGRNSSQR